MTTMLFVTPKKQDPRLRAALAAAVTRIVDESGGQKVAAKRLGIDQSAISEIVNKKRTIRIETIVSLRNSLKISIDELLQLPPLGAEPPADAALEVVLEFYGNRWEGLPLNIDKLKYTNIPKGGWKAAFDELSARLSPGHDERPRRMRPKSRRVSTEKSTSSARAQASINSVFKPLRDKAAEENQAPVHEDAIPRKRAR